MAWTPFGLNTLKQLLSGKGATPVKNLIGGFTHPGYEVSNIPTSGPKAPLNYSTVRRPPTGPPPPPPKPTTPTVTTPPVTKPPAQTTPAQPTYTPPIQPEPTSTYAPPSRPAEPEIDLAAIAREQEQARLAKEATQKAEEEGLFKQYEEKAGAQEKLGTAYERLLKEGKVPEAQSQLDILRGQVTKVKDLLDRLEQDISSRTGGFMVTESQRRRQIAAEEAPLRTELGRLATGQATAAEQVTSGLGQAGTKLQLVSSEQAKELDPLKMRISAFSDRAAREMTGFVQSKQTELTALLDKLQRQRTLNDQEWVKANTLAQEERNYQKQRDLISFQTNEAIRQKAATARVGEAGPTAEEMLGLPASVSGGTVAGIPTTKAPAFDLEWNKLFGGSASLR